MSLADQFDAFLKVTWRMGYTVWSDPAAREDVVADPRKYGIMVPLIDPHGGPATTVLINRLCLPYFDEIRKMEGAIGTYTEADLLKAIESDMNRVRDDHHHGQFHYEFV
jgi:hypothetical protein